MKKTRKARERTSFQIFLVSRVTSMLIIVVGIEYLVFFLANYFSNKNEGEMSLGALILLITLFAGPLLGATYWLCKTIQEEVIRREEELEEEQLRYERKRNLMLSDIAHDLRTPITTIAGYSKAINDNMVIDQEKRAEYLEVIENKAERMNQLINLLFEYVKMDSDSFGLKKEPMDIAEAMRKTAALLYTDVEEKGMTLEIDIPEEPCLVEGDELQISRVFVNIINNSLRHNEPGTVISLELKGDYTNREIIISDDGVPIEEEVALHIFEPFVVGDKSRRTKGGSGLGLSIAKRIVDMHGWELSLIQNQRGYKKAFIITLHESK